MCSIPPVQCTGVQCVGVQFDGLQYADVQCAGVQCPDTQFAGVQCAGVHCAVVQVDLGDSNYHLPNIKITNVYCTRQEQSYTKRNLCFRQIFHSVILLQVGVKLFILKGYKKGLMNF